MGMKHRNEKLPKCGTGGHPVDTEMKNEETWNLFIFTFAFGLHLI